MAEKEAEGWRATLDEHGVPLRRAPERNPELEAAILAAPDERSNYLVYSDWLTEAGDPRGELVTVQAALEETPKSKPLAKRAAELWKAHSRDWLGTLDGMNTHAPIPGVSRPPNPLALDWRWGFVREARLRQSFSYEHDNLYVALVRLAIMAFVQDLTIEVPESGERIVPTICTEPLPPLLRRFTLLFRWTDRAIDDLVEHHARFASLDELRVGVPLGSSPRDAMLEPLRYTFGKRVTFLSPSDVEPY